MGGTKMKHFTTEEWIDFVNRVTSPKQQEAMKKHLGTGCKQCKESVALWQKLHKTAAMEAMYQPPQADVRLAKAAFAAAGAGAHRNKKSSLVEGMFDSLFHPILAGGPVSGVGARPIDYPAHPHPIGSL